MQPTRRAVMHATVLGVLLWDVEDLFQKIYTVSMY